MKLNEIKGVSHYLENDCYCTGEIYDRTGFFYDVYTGEEECSKLGQVGSALIVLCKNQILLLQTNGEVVADIRRFDATENNIKEFKNFINSGGAKLTLDEFKEGSTEKSLKEIMGMADAIMIS